MHSLGKWMLLVLTVMGITVGLVNKSHAIPAFSREHNTECSTCHTIFPELNEYGDAFRKNGFVWAKHRKDDAAVDKKNAVKGEGDPETLKKLKEVATVGNPKKDDEATPAGQKKSEPLWLAGLPQTLPLSISATLNASYNDDANFNKTDLSTRAISLLGGGVFRDKIAFFLKYNLYAQGEYDPAISNTPLNAGSPFSNDLEEFWLEWRNTLDTPVNIKAGRLRPQLSIWQKSNKSGISDFATSAYTVGQSNFRIDSPTDAVELNAILFNRLYVAAGVVDRDNQDSNEGYGSFSVKIGGSDYHAKEPDLDLDKASMLDYMYVTLGGYGYSGRNSISNASTERNNFFRGGVDMDLVIMDARLKLAWAHGQDSNPDYLSHNELKSDALVAQGEYLLTSSLLAMLRYEYIHLDDGTTTNRLIPAITYAPMQNAKFTLEYQHAETGSNNVNIALLGIRVAF